MSWLVDLDWVYEDDASYNRNIEIKRIYVDPSQRRCGLALAHLREFLHRNDAGTAWYSLWTSDECEEDGSWSLYEKAGFREVCLLENYYRPGVGTRLFVRRGDAP